MTLPDGPGKRGIKMHGRRAGEMLRMCDQRVTMRTQHNHIEGLPRELRIDPRLQDVMNGKPLRWKHYCRPRRLSRARLSRPAGLADPLSCNDNVGDAEGLAQGSDAPEGCSWPNE